MDLTLKAQEMQFTLKTMIPASPSDIYAAWLDSEGHTQMTGGEAMASNQVGGKFSAWDDYIHGENIELELNCRIKQTWRTTQFKEGDEDSILEIILSELDGETELTLIHSHVPEDGEHYKTGWDVHYFQPMIAYFTDRK